MFWGALESAVAQISAIEVWIGIGTIYANKALGAKNKFYKKYSP